MRHLYAMSSASMRRWRTSSLGASLPFSYIAMAVGATFTMVAKSTTVRRLRMRASWSCTERAYR